MELEIENKDTYKAELFALKPLLCAHRSKIMHELDIGHFECVPGPGRRLWRTTDRKRRAMLPRTCKVCLTVAI